MSRSLLLRAAKSYHAQIPRNLSVRGYWGLFGFSDGEDEEYGNGGKNGTNGNGGKNGANGNGGKNGANGKNGTNGKNGANGNVGKNGTNGNGGKNGSNGKPYGNMFFKKHQTPSDIISDVEKRIKDGETNIKSSKGMWAKVLEKKEQCVTAATALVTGAVASFWKVGSYVTTKYIDKRFQAFETKLTKGDGRWITPTIMLHSSSHEELKYIVPMPGMDVHECSYGWDIDGLSLSILGDNGQYVLRYTPEVPRKFRHGKVTLESCAKGNLVVSVKARGYKDPSTQTEQQHNSAQQNFSDLTGTKSSPDAPNIIGLKFLVEEAGDEIKESSNSEETK